MPTLDKDAILGDCYISLADFTARRKSLGVNSLAYNLLTADAGTANAEITSILAQASRDIDAFCGRSFSFDSIVENHKFSLQTRKIFPNQPPVVELESFKIFIAPSSYQTIALTPTTTFEGRTVSWGSIIYNWQENFLEVASLAVLTAANPVILSLGITDPLVEIKYKTWQAVPQQIAAACGMLAAHRINNTLLNNLAVQGVNSASTKDQSITRETGWNLDIPDNIKRLLQRYVRIAIG